MNEWATDEVSVPPSGGKAPVCISEGMNYTENIANPAHELRQGTNGTGNPGADKEPQTYSKYILENWKLQMQ